MVPGSRSEQEEGEARLLRVSSITQWILLRVQILFFNRRVALYIFLPILIGFCERGSIKNQWGRREIWIFWISRLPHWFFMEPFSQNPVGVGKNQPSSYAKKSWKSFLLKFVLKNNNIDSHWSNCSTYYILENKCPFSLVILKSMTNEHHCYCFWKQIWEERLDDNNASLRGRLETCILLFFCRG